MKRAKKFEIQFDVKDDSFGKEIPKHQVTSEEVFFYSTGRDDILLRPEKSLTQLKKEVFNESNY